MEWQPIESYDYDLANAVMVTNGKTVAFVQWDGPSDYPWRIVESVFTDATGTTMIVLSAESLHKDLPTHFMVPTPPSTDGTV